ncbi:MAG: 8-amino-7-oxononanoate synthase [Candidatus Omnitrophica bacterium]|nr:8-amino-7-oxononanoate synthase [Candidatus Omnitrophota bacterium]
MDSTAKGARPLSQFKQSQIPSDFFEEELAALRQKNLYRRMLSLTRTKGPKALLDGREILLFCGNDYLGLSQHPRVIAAAGKAAEHYGVGSGAARLISGTLDLHTQLENELAKLKKKERALLFTAGYLANLGILSALAGPKDLIVMDKLCHASLIDGARLSGAEMRVFPHKNYERCEEMLQKNSTAGRCILVSDTVFSMDGDLADLKKLIRLKQKYNCLLVVDDAHGTGVLGLNGAGAAEDENLENQIDVILGTLSKGLGCLGGFAAADRAVIEYLINVSRPFIFATSLPPLLCASALEALKVIKEEPSFRQKLWRNIQKAHEGLSHLGFSLGAINSPILPVILGPEEEALGVSRHLLKQGIFVPAIRYPTVPKGKARLRVTISALHRDEDIKRLLTTLGSLGKKARF